MAVNQTTNPTSFYKMEDSKIEDWFSEEIYHAKIHYSLLLSLGKKKKRLKLYLILVSLSVTAVIQAQKEYWLPHKARDKFLKNTYFKTIPGVDCMWIGKQTNKPSDIIGRRKAEIALILQS